MLPAALPRRALDGLHEFGRYVNDLEYRARQTLGAENARAFLADWLKEIDYEKHLYDGEDSEKVAAARRGAFRSEYRARQTLGAENARAFLADWLKEIDYEKHLYDGEDSEKVAAARRGAF